MMGIGVVGDLMLNLGDNITDSLTSLGVDGDLSLKLVTTFIDDDNDDESDDLSALC